MLIRKAKHANAKEQRYFIFVALVSLVDDLVTIGTLGYFTSNLRAWALFRDREES